MTDCVTCNLICMAVAPLQYHPVVSNVFIHHSFAEPSDTVCNSTVSNQHPRQASLQNSGPLSPYSSYRGCRGC